MLIHRGKHFTISQNEHICPLQPHIFEYLVKNKEIVNWKKKIKKYQLTQEQLEYILETAEYLLTPDDIHKLITNKSVSMEWLNRYRAFIPKYMWWETIPIFMDYDLEFLLKNIGRMDPYTVIVCKTFATENDLKTYVDAVITQNYTDSLDKYERINKLFYAMAFKYPLTVSFIESYKKYFLGTCDNKNVFYEMLFNEYLSTHVINYYAPEIKKSLNWDRRAAIEDTIRNPHNILNITKLHDVNKLMDNYYDILSCYFEILMCFDRIDDKYIERYINEFNLTQMQPITWDDIINTVIYFKPQSEINQMSPTDNNIHDMGALLAGQLTRSPGLFLLDTDYGQYFRCDKHSRTQPFFWYVYSIHHLPLHSDARQAEQLAAKYKMNIRWEIISELQQMSEAFIEEHIEYIDLNILMMNQWTRLSKEFLYKHREKINTHNMEWYLRVNKYFKWITIQRRIIEYVYAPRETKNNLLIKLETKFNETKFNETQHKSEILFNE